MSGKTWTDQPDEVEHAIKIGSFTIEAHDERRVSHRAQVELRTRTPMESPQVAVYYVTAGNLFGSQTVKCESAVVVLTVLCNMGKNTSLPKGAELMESAK